MSDKMTKQQRSRCMSHIRSKDTTPEIVLRKELFRLGFRFRKNVRSLPGTPDIVLPKYRTCIFINGCFWHGHRGCRYYTIPKTNAGFWKDKIRRNVERDAADVQNLEVLSWNVITVWECELKPKRLAATVEHVVSELSKNQSNWEEYLELRRKGRAFATEQARRHRELMVRLEVELSPYFHTSPKIRRMEKDDR